MDYREILEEEKNKLRSDLKWWPSFVYHFTDVHNASNILQSGWIYSRQMVEDKQIVTSENASRAVIDATRFDNKIYGRLYFRPLTPTQFHNEGFKPRAIRDLDINANCPVPIFLCLSANETLNYSDTQFAEKGLSGFRHNIQSGIDEFAKLNFAKIYHEGFYDREESDIKDYRQSEVVREQGFPVEPLLKAIMCRTQAEKETLLYLMQQFSRRMYNTYREKVFYKPQYKLFYNNGIFIKTVEFSEDELEITLNDPEQRINNQQKDVYVEVVIEVWYRQLDGSVLDFQKGRLNVNYKAIRYLVMPLRKKVRYELLKVCIRFDESVMYENEIRVQNELF